MFIEMDGSLTQASGNTALQNAARSPPPAARKSSNGSDFGVVESGQRAAVLSIYLFVALCKIFIYFESAAGGNRVGGEAVGARYSLALTSAQISRQSYSAGCGVDV